jgi:ComF family protein
MNFLFYWNAFVDLVFPNTCVACNDVLQTGEDTLCTACRISLPRTESHIVSNEILKQKFYGKVPVENAFAYLKFIKKGKVQRLLHELKYRNQPEIGEVLGKMYGIELKEVGFQQATDLLVPVPLHPAKKSMRGYNQADCIAQGLSEALALPWDANILHKETNTNSQTRKGRFDRFQNVSRGFVVAKPQDVIAKRITLVDDMVTTGATLEACATVLLEAGASQISIITLAMA